MQQSLTHEDEIRQVFMALGRAGVKVILLKGGDFRLRLYKDPALRPMLDMDLIMGGQNCLRL